MVGQARPVLVVRESLTSMGAAPVSLRGRADLVIGVGADHQVPRCAVHQVVVQGRRLARGELVILERLQVDPGPQAIASHTDRLLATPDLIAAWWQVQAPAFSGLNSENTKERDESPFRRLHGTDPHEAATGPRA